MKKYAIVFVVLVLFIGCESPSTKLALAGASRSAAVQGWVVSKYDKALNAALFREALEKMETNTDRASILNELGGRLQETREWYAQFQLAQGVHDATVLPKLEASRGWLGLVSENLKSRVASLAPPESEAPATGAETETGVDPSEAPPPPVSLDDRTIPSSDHAVKRPKSLRVRYAKIDEYSSERFGCAEDDADVEPDGFWNAGVFHAYKDTPIRLVAGG